MMNILKWSYIKLTHKLLYNHYVLNNSHISDMDDAYQKVFKTFNKNFVYEITKELYKKKHTHNTVSIHNQDINFYCMTSNINDDPPYSYMQDSQYSTNNALIVLTETGVFHSLYILDNSNIEAQTFFSKVLQKQLLPMNSSKLGERNFLNMVWKNIIKSINDDFNIKKVLMTQDKTDLYSFAQSPGVGLKFSNKALLDSIKKHLPEAYKYILFESKEQEYRDNQNRTNTKNIKVDSFIPEIITENKIEINNITLDKASNTMEAKTISIINSHIQTIANNIKCHTLKINNSSIGPNGFHNIQCEEIFINNADIPLNILEQLKSKNIKIFMNGTDEYGQQIPKKEKIENNSIQTLESINQEPFQRFLKPFIIDDMVINNITNIDGLGTRLLDFISPEIQEHIYHQNTYPRNNMIEGIADFIALSVAHSIIHDKEYNQPYNFMLEQKKVSSYFYSDLTREPKYMFTDGSFSKDKITKGTVILLDKDFKLQSILFGLTQNKDINHEKFAYLIGQKFLNKNNWKNENIHWFTDIDINTKEKMNIKNIQSSHHFLKRQSFTTQLFIDGICHQLAKNAELEFFMNKNAKPKKDKAYHEKKKEILAQIGKTFTQKEKQDSSNLLKEVNTLRLHDMILKDNEISDYIADINVENLIIKNMDIDNLSDTIKANNVVRIEDSHIDFLTDTIQCYKLHIKNTTINNIARNITGEIIHIVDSEIFDKPKITLTGEKKLIIVRSPSIEKWLPDIIKENPGVKITMTHLKSSKSNQTLEQ